MEDYFNLNCKRNINHIMKRRGLTAVDIFNSLSLHSPIFGYLERTIRRVVSTNTDRQIRLVEIVEIARILKVSSGDLAFIPHEEFIQKYKG